MSGPTRDEIRAEALRSAARKFDHAAAVWRREADRRGLAADELNTMREYERAATLLVVWSEDLQVLRRFTDAAVGRAT